MTLSIRHHRHILTSGCYVAMAEMEDDDEPFEDKMGRLTAELQVQMDQAARLDTLVRANLEELGCGLPT